MRRTIMPLLLALCAIAPAAWAQEDPPVRSISVSGTVETKIAPDLVVWSITLTDTDKDMQKAKKRNDEKIDAVVALRKTLDVAEGDIETGSVSIRKEYERVPQGGRGEFKHFVVNRQVTIRQRDLKRFDEFLDSLVSSAEMEVYFSFESSKMYEVRADTRLAALRIAKDKARAMVDAVGAKLGDVITITEDAPTFVNPMTNGIMAQSSITRSAPDTDSATERFIPGAMTVRMTVYATFAIT